MEQYLCLLVQSIDYNYPTYVLLSSSARYRKTESRREFTVKQLHDWLGRQGIEDVQLTLPRFACRPI